MRSTTIITSALTAIVVSFLVMACGKSDQSGGKAQQSHDQTASTALAPKQAMPESHDHSKHQASQPEAKAGPVKNGFDGMPAPGTDARCPVMKNDFKVAADSTFSVHEGKTYVFCCPGCKAPFEENPKKFIAAN